MKYHKYEIVKVSEDLGEEDERLNCVYKIYKDSEYRATALTLGTAKEFIDGGEDDNYL